jgi:hypothetical protein
MWEDVGVGWGGAELDGLFCEGDFVFAGGEGEAEVLQADVELQHLYLLQET